MHRPCSSLRTRSPMEWRCQRRRVRRAVSRKPRIAGRATWRRQMLVVVGEQGRPVSEPKARVRLTSGVDALLRPARRTGMTDGHLWSPGAVAIRVVVISGRVRAAGDPGCHIAE